MNFKRFSPAITLSLLLITSLLASTQLQAGASNKSGNPFGNSTFFPDSGTFSAIVRGTNGFLGVVQFVTSTTNTSTAIETNAGVATIYAEGQQFVGSAFGSISGSTIAATYSGNYGYSVLLPSNTVTASLAVTTNSVSPPSTNTAYASQSITNTLSGQLNATLYNTYPTQSFSGAGEANVILSRVNQTNFTIEFFQHDYTNTVTGTRLVE